MLASIVRALRKATDVAIKVDSYPIILTPHLRVSAPGGVYNWVPQLPRAVQNLTLESIAATGELTKSDGASMHKWDYEIVGRYDAQMAVGDTWTNGGTIYRITAIKPFNQYEQRGVVSAIGKDPNYGI